MTILSIETSTKVCSAALSRDGKVIVSYRDDSGANHARMLPEFIEKIRSEYKPSDWDAVALSTGPGSYTGLRIGTSFAKGLCYGLNIPLIPIDTLQIMAADPRLDGYRKEGYTLLPLMDARRMEVYCAFYDGELNRKNDVEAKVVEDRDWVQGKVVFFGDGAAKCREILENEETIFADEIVPLAENMSRIAENIPEKQWIKGTDLAYAEPFYLKEFVAAPSHVKGLV